MKKKLASYFFYTHSERNGVLILIALSWVILLLPKLYNSLQKPISVTDFSAFEKAVATFEPSHNESKNEHTEGGDFEDEKQRSALFGFNPNTASREKLIQLGLSPKVATTLIHYRERGGQFRHQEDLKKIYGITAENYNRLKAYIELDNEKFSWQQGGYKTEFQKEASIGTTTKREVILKSFDPNTATESDLLGLGLEEKTVKILLKYRENKGIFYKKEDLRKLYTFSDIDFIRIEKYIQFPDNHIITEKSTTINSKELVNTTKEKNRSIIVDVNTASQDDLLQIRGIGSIFAARIINHRERLGGFATIEQLKEVYLPDSTVKNIAPNLKLTTLVSRKLHINKAAPDALTHPYLTRKQAESLVRYRLNHGEFKTINDIKQTGLFSDTHLEKLRPYMSFE
ncbi:MAG: helix-hairpin-helix domain-containing protein [Saprospiraceae bacterium]|nr:helix-hairpin-helix domain-containing protein [Saprospiraceae bacterium]